MFVETGNLGRELFGRRRPVPHLRVPRNDLQGDVVTTGADKNWRMRFLHGLGLKLALASWKYLPVKLERSWVHSSLIACSVSSRRPKRPPIVWNGMPYS
jgi:hypothetical protein